MNSNDKVYVVLSKIPKGKVLTYGLLAELSGVRNPRVVGNILHKNPYGPSVPCHRVVNAQGRLAPAYAFGGPDEQARRLQEEGLEVVGNQVSLEKYLWRTDETNIER